MLETKPRILVVDDEKGILSSLSRLLSIRYEQCLIGTAESAEEALEILASHPVQLLITDFKLPAMNGLDLAQQVHERSPQTHAILMTAYGNSSFIHRAHSEGCMAYLEKPIDFDKLTQIIDRALNARQSASLHVTGLTLPDVIQIYGMKKERAVLRVEGTNSFGNPLYGIVVLAEGVITHAEWGASTGVDALLEMLEAENVDVHNAYCQLSTPRSINVTWFQLSAAQQAQTEEERKRLISPLSNQAALETAEDLDYGSLTKDESIAQIIASFKHKATPKAELRKHEPDLALLRKTEPSSFYRREIFSRPSSEAQADAKALHGENLENRKKIRELVNEGVELFRLKDFDEARRCWLSALELDPECSQAKKNLELLRSVENRKASH